MTTLGQALQILGLIIAPIGMVHFFTSRAYLSEVTLMSWELGCLFVGALCFLVGNRLVRSK